MIDEWDYFYSLCRKKEEVKSVKCIGCGKKFRGTDSKRRCSACCNHRIFNKSSVYI